MCNKQFISTQHLHKLKQTLNKWVNLYLQILEEI